MWTGVITLCGLILVLSNSKLIRTGGYSLLAVVTLHLLGVFSYLISFGNTGVVYLQTLGMFAYSIPLWYLSGGTLHSLRESITATCFLTLLVMEGLYLVDHLESIGLIAGSVDVVVNSICFTLLVIFNMREGTRNGFRILTGVSRLYARMRDNSLLHIEGYKLLAR